MQQKAWYRYSIFISSTFKDMDEERDAIKFDVINRLNWHYRDQYIQFQAIDLRIGINTEDCSEEQSEDMVLDVCLDNIEKSRPFFVCLLGNRYGWIPDEKRWESIISQLSAEKRRLLSGSRHCSVTEMEIMYGAIGNNGENLNHSLFFFRNDESYESIPESIKPFYANADDTSCTKEDLSLKEKRLKQKILDIAWENNMEENCSYYTLSWNQGEKRFDGIEAFSELAYTKLCKEIDKEISTHIPPQRWQQQEHLYIDALVANYYDGKSLSNQLTTIVEEVERNGQILLTGEHGCGKSVLFAQVAHLLSEKEGYLCLIAFVGASNHSQKMLDIAIRWINETEVVTGQAETPEEELANYDSAQVYVLLTELIYQAGKKGIKVIIMLDAIENLANVVPNDIYLSWLPDDIPFLGTAIRKEDRMRLHHRKMVLHEINIQDKTSLEEIINCHEKRFSIALPFHVKEDIIGKALRPVQIDMLMRVYANLTSKDYDKIRNSNGETEIQKINRYMETLYRNIPTYDISVQFFSMISHALDCIQAKSQLLPALQYIALSGIGLNENDLECLLKDKWNVLKFHKLMTMLTDFFTEDRNSKRWNYKNSVFKESVLYNCPQKKEMYREMAQLLLSYSHHEQQKQDILFFCLIESEDATLGRELLTTANSNQLHIRGNWYEISLLYLLQDHEIGSHIRNLCQKYNAAERVGFVYYLYLSVPCYSQLPLFCQIEADVLSEIDVMELDVSNAYWLATFYGHLYQSHKSVFSKELHIQQGDLSKGTYYLSRFIDFYRRCYILDPDYSDVKNMLKAAMSEMLPIIAQEGDFEKVKQYYDEISNIK